MPAKLGRDLFSLAKRQLSREMQRPVSKQGAAKWPGKSIGQSYTAPILTRNSMWPLLTRTGSPHIEPFVRFHGSVGEGRRQPYPRRVATIQARRT